MVAPSNSALRNTNLALVSSRRGAGGAGGIVSGATEDAGGLLTTCDGSLGARGGAPAAAVATAMTAELDKPSSRARRRLPVVIFPIGPPNLVTLRPDREALGVVESPSWFGFGVEVRAGP
jgi:hypothetical protein